MPTNPLPTLPDPVPAAPGWREAYRCLSDSLSYLWEEIGIVQEKDRVRSGPEITALDRKGREIGIKLEALGKALQLGIHHEEPATVPQTKAEVATQAFIGQLYEWTNAIAEEEGRLRSTGAEPDERLRLARLVHQVGLTLGRTAGDLISYAQRIGR